MEYVHNLEKKISDVEKPYFKGIGFILGNSIEKITEELKKDASMIDFLQPHEMLPGTEIIVADAGDYSITISTNKSDYFGIDQFIAKRVFVS